MAMITKNEYGIVAVNNSVLSKMIIDHILSFEDMILPCSRKGKVIRKGFFTGYHEYNNAIELEERSSRMRVKIYAAARFDGDLSGAADQLFDLIEEDFDMVCLERPQEICLEIIGFIAEGSRQPIGDKRLYIRKRN